MYATLSRRGSADIANRCRRSVFVARGAFLLWHAAPVRGLLHFPTSAARRRTRPILFTLGFSRWLLGSWAGRAAAALGWAAWPAGLAGLAGRRSRLLPAAPAPGFAGRLGCAGWTLLVAPGCFWGAPGCSCALPVAFLCGSRWLLRAPGGWSQGGRGWSGFRAEFDTTRGLVVMVFLYEHSLPSVCPLSGADKGTPP